MKKKRGGEVKEELGGIGLIFYFSFSFSLSLSLPKIVWAGQECKCTWLQGREKRKEQLANCIFPTFFFILSFASLIKKYKAKQNKGQNVDFIQNKKCFKVLPRANQTRKRKLIPKISKVNVTKNYKIKPQMCHA